MRSAEGKADAAVDTAQLALDETARLEDKINAVKTTVARLDVQVAAHTITINRHTGYLNTVVKVLTETHK